VWHAAHQAVYWTDINRFLIHRLTPANDCVRTWFFEEPVTAITLTDRDDLLLVVLGSRIILWEPSSDVRSDSIFQLHEWPRVRLNDARADARGRLWVGSMRNNVNPDGSEGEAGGTDGKLYRIDPNGGVSVHRDRIGISNTVAWSPDNRRFYFADSLANIVWAYDYDAARGTIANEQAFLPGFECGIPDGSAVDAQGYLWNCRWGGGCIVRVAPSGEIDRLIEMPVKNVTTCTFGGAHMKTLYVTTALGGAPGDRLAGGLFAIQSEIPGMPEHRFRWLQHD
jgi:sugar lactone lactonase YvrE